jgi:hypothetical protein
MINGYFIYDLVYGYVKKYNDFDMHFHHVVSTLFLAWPLFSGFYGAEAVETVIQAEITNPLINAVEVFPLWGAKFDKHTPKC